MGNRSGKLLAKNDHLIRDLLNNPDYKVSDNGSIHTLIQRTGQRSINDNWRELPQQIKSSGYYYVNYKYKNLSIHRIIYLKFNEGNFEDLVINHIDGNTLNNSIENLEMVPQSVNNTHRFRVLKNPAVKGNCRITQEIANHIRDLSSNGKSYKEIMEIYDLSKGHISSIINKKIWK